MFRDYNIFNVLLVLSTSVNAIYNVTNSQRTLNSGTKIYLNKCCPSGTCVRVRKTCGNYAVAIPFFKIKVYDEDINLSAKSFEDLFTLIPNKFKDTAFKRNAIDVRKLDRIVYLTESGAIHMELPNAYDRWRKIPKDSYCIDVDDRNGKEPRFWAILSDEPMTVIRTYDSILLTIALLLSCFCMLLVLIVYFLLPELRNCHGLILMAYVFSLFMAFTLLAVIQIHSINNEACLGVASGIYFFFLATFCWMSVMSYDMWWTFRSMLKRRVHRKGDYFKFMMYGLYAWGVPLFLTIGLVTVNTLKDEMRKLPWFVTPGIPDKGCFLQGGVKLLYFYTPMLILIICNWMFFVMTAINIWQSNRKSAVLDSTSAGNKQAHRAQTQRLILYLKLSVVMGLSWLLEIISFVSLKPGGLNVWYISDTYNSLIGLAMFLIFVCKKSIWRKLRKRFTCWSSKSLSHSRAESSQENIALKSMVSSQPNGLSDDEFLERAHGRRSASG